MMITLVCHRRRLGLHHQLLGVTVEVGARLALLPLHAAVKQPGHHQDRRGQGDPGAIMLYVLHIFFPYIFIGAGRGSSRGLLGNTKGEKEEERVMYLRISDTPLL